MSAVYNGADSLRTFPLFDGFGRLILSHTKATDLHLGQSPKKTALGAF
jgi:hypothetical protein